MRCGPQTSRQLAEPAMVTSPFNSDVSQKSEPDNKRALVMCVTWNSQVFKSWACPGHTSVKESRERAVHTACGRADGMNVSIVSKEHDNEQGGFGY
jgi:hypothetical protein